MKDKRDGVDIYLCDCGPIIKEGLDLDALEQRVGGHEQVRAVHRHSTLCSEEGRAWMAERLKQTTASRHVIAACSPREHEKTFQGVFSDVGENPYLFTMANIREQCAWVTADRDAATVKALALIRASVERSLRQQALQVREIIAEPDVLVIGAGVAGMTAARTLARSGRRVYLVERDPVIGGRAARLSDLYPGLECASCVIEPLLDEVLHEDNISLYTYSEVEEILGYFGNYQVKVRRKARRVDPDRCLGMQCCHEVCPVEVPNDFEAGLAQRKAIYIPYAGALPNVSVIDQNSCLHLKDGSCDACVAACPFGAIDLGARDERVELKVGTIVVATGASLSVVPAEDTPYDLPQVFTAEAMERMLSSAGCTSGEVRGRNGEAPKKIALLHCADERGAAPAQPCSAICCMAMTKYARLLHEKLPDAEVTLFHWERCVGGKGFRELAHDVAAETGHGSVVLERGDTVRVQAGAESDQQARLVLQRSGGQESHDFDLVVLAPPLEAASNTAEVARELRLELDDQGFLAEEHDRMRSFASRVDGVFVAGCAQGPKDVEASCAHGAAAAGAVMAALQPGRRLRVEAARAELAEERCGGCQTCPAVCPFKAISFDHDKGVAIINDLLCHGCGVCAAACPSSAITARHFTDGQIEAEIEALLTEF